MQMHHVMHEELHLVCVALKHFMGAACGVLNVGVSCCWSAVDLWHGCLLLQALLTKDCRTEQHGGTHHFLGRSLECCQIMYGVLQSHKCEFDSDPTRITSMQFAGGVCGAYIPVRLHKRSPIFVFLVLPCLGEVRR